MGLGQLSIQNPHGDTKRKKAATLTLSEKKKGVDGHAGKISDATKQFETVRIKMMYFVSSGLLQYKHFVGKIVDSLEVDVKHPSRKESEAKIVQNLDNLVQFTYHN